MTIERLLVILEDRIQEHESMSDDGSEEKAGYHEGYAMACRWVLETLEEAFLHGELGDVPEDDEEDRW